MVHVVSFFGSLFTNVYKSSELFDDKKSRNQYEKYTAV